MKCHSPPPSSFSSATCLVFALGIKTICHDKLPMLSSKRDWPIFGRRQRDKLCREIAGKVSNMVRNRQSERSVLPAYCFDNMPACFVSFFCNPTLSFVPVTSVRVQKKSKFRDWEQNNSIRQGDKSQSRRKPTYPDRCNKFGLPL